MKKKKSITSAAIDVVLEVEAKLIKWRKEQEKNAKNRHKQASV